MNPLEPQLRQWQCILAISHELVANHSLDDILQHIIQAATELTDCESAAILLVDESSSVLRFIAATLHQDRLLQFPVPIEGSIAGTAFASDQPIIANMPSVDPRHYSRIAELLNYPARSLLAVPLKFHDRKIGVLEAENKNQEHHFDATDAQVLAALATQATIAIENARQIERYKHLAHAEQTQRQMAEALRLASAALASTLDYDQVIDRILEQVSQVIPSDTSNVMMIESGNIARVFRGRGYAEFGTAETLEATTLKVDHAARLRQMRETRQPIVIPDVLQDPTWVYSRSEHQWIRSDVGTPIIVRDSVVIAERIRVEDELRRHRDHLEELVKARTAEIHRLAITDPLTDLFNRRHWMILGNQALEQARRYRYALSAMLIDIDHFKRINDTYGHVVGDKALRQLADQLKKSLRSVDILGRYGGEEFVVLMPETDRETACPIAERLRMDIRALRIDVMPGQIGLTASIGVAAWNETQTIDTLIMLADRAMYAAKQAGRDRVVVETQN